jgi:glycosyltransferase involved in cell wall biosynthesis
MKLIALMPTRNSAWTLPASARSALRWCDGIVIHDHASTDETPAVIDALAAEYPGRVHRIREENPFWREASHRQRLLEAGRGAGGDCFALVDDDEFLTANLLPDIRATVESLSPAEVLQIPWIICWRGLDQYRNDDSVWSRSYVSMAFRDAPQLCWQAREHDYQHHHRHPFNSTHQIPWTDLNRGGLLHIQHASWRRLLSKQALYEAREILHYPNFTAEQIRARYGPTVNEDGAKFSPVPAAWWTDDKSLIALDAEPWQEAEVRRLVAEHGRERFSQIDLFGVA